VTADLSRLEEAERVFAAALEAFGQVDVLVNNAAWKGSRPFLDLDAEVYARSFEDNVRIVYGLGRLAARHMAGRGGGAIVNVSSVGGLRPHRGTAGYDASKGAIDNLTRVMAVELAPHGIRVNAVAPGFTPPEELRRRRSDLEMAKARHIPLGRGGTGEDSAAAIAFLASDAAAYITGQILYVDGGLTTQLTPQGISV
jgi:NAD(P)-dependent dehydrogenase (short-subunit alcohol dehydrogenase family)